MNQLRSRKFPAVIVDCIDKPAASDLLELCRRSGSNKSSVVLGLTDGTQSATSWGMNFALKRPENLDLRPFVALLRAAEGMILQDFRHYRRIPIDTPVVLENEEHRLRLSAVNVSGGGMCLQGEILGWNKEHRLQLTHPEMGARFQAKSFVVWSSSGMSGIQFRCMSLLSRDALSGWLDSH